MAENSETEITNPHILMVGTASLHRTSRFSVRRIGRSASPCAIPQAVLLRADEMI